MSALYCARVERRDFGDLLSADGLSRLNIRAMPDYGVLGAPDGNAVFAVWSSDPKAASMLPHLLICRDGTESDWAAWLTTFAAKIRPFSAYMRLITATDVGKVTKEVRIPVLGHLEWPVSGLVLGEVLAGSRLPDKALETLPASAFASTLSFALFRAAATYDDFGQWHRLVESWESTRQITKQKPRPVDGASVARICAIIMDAGGILGTNKFLNRRDEPMSAVCHLLLNSPDRLPSDLSNIPYFAETEAMMHGPRENRVVAFENFVRRTEGASLQPPELMSFILGYLASRIAPGTIRHSSVLSPIADRYPTAVLWYGFCAGLGEAAIILPRLAGRQGVELPVSARRVARELLRTDSVLRSPDCDIGFLELVALSRTGGDPLEGLITTTQSAATVELAPFVWTVVNASSKPLAEAPIRAGRERTIIATLGRQIESLAQVYNDLVRQETFSEKDEQPSLFQSRRRKK